MLPTATGTPAERRAAAHVAIARRAVGAHLTLTPEERKWLGHEHAYARPGTGYYEPTGLSPRAGSPNRA